MSSASVEGVQPSGPLREPPVTKAPAGHRRSHLGLEPAPRVTYKGSEKQGGVDVEKRERASPRAAVIRSASGSARRPLGRSGLGPGGYRGPAATAAAARAVGRLQRWVAEGVLVEELV